MGNIFYFIATFRATSFALQVGIVSCAVLRVRNFHVAKSGNDAYSLQHENLLRGEAVIRATNNRHLQPNTCCVTSCKRILPVLRGLKNNGDRLHVLLILASN